MVPNKFDKIVLVTGANQGLGLAVIEVAGKRYPSNTYILCARDIEKGQQAVNQLRDSGVTAVIEVMELDVTNDDSIKACLATIRTNYGRLDGTSTHSLKTIQQECKEMIKQKQKD